MATVPYQDYLRTEPYMADMVGARALASAFELGVIDALLALLRGMLGANQVVEAQGGQYALAAGFRTALVYRDLMVEKLAFANLVAPDFTELLSVLLADP